MNVEDMQKALEAIGKSGITVNGDLVLEKHVAYEVANVEAGGVGIQVVNGKDEQPLTSSDKDIKAVIECLMTECDENGLPLFQNKKQWWAVFRVLSFFCNYPIKMTSFVAKIKELDIEYKNNQNSITYDSLSAAVKDVPLMASCSPSSWCTLKDKSDNYKQQYKVAEFLMLKLGIKS